MRIAVLALSLSAMSLVPGCGDDDVAAGIDAGAAIDATAIDPTEAVFDPDRLLVVEIEMAPADWDTLRFEHHDFLAANGEGCQDSPPPKPYNFYTASVTIEGETVANVGVRKKGFLGSVTPRRPSLKIKFDHYDAAQRYAGMSRLTLNNNNQDDSQLDACLSYGLFRAAGVPAPRCNFARVSVNGQDLGIFSNVESLKKPLLARWFADDSGNLYEGVFSDFRDGWLDTFELKTNKLAGDRSDLATVAPALAKSDAEVLAALGAVVDIDEFMSFWAVEALVNHWDGYSGDTNNFYVYHDPTSDKFHFLPWGADAAFGIPNPFPPIDRPESVDAMGAVARRLYEIPETRAMYRQRLQEVLDDVYDETALLAEIDRIEALVEDHVHVSAGRFGSGVSRVRDFVSGRRAALQAELDAAAPAWDHLLRDNPCLVKVGAMSGDFDTTWQDPFPQAFPLGVGSGTLAVTLDGVTPTLGGQGFNAGRGALVNGDREGILILAIRDDTGDAVGLYMGVEPELYQTGTIPVDAYTTFAVALEGPLSARMPLRGFLFGTLELTQAGTAPGEPVTGSFDLEVWGAAPAP